MQEAIKIKIDEDKSQELNILVVDDDEDIRLILKEVLSLPGYNVLTASGGLEAINMLKEVGFDIVITDIDINKAAGRLEVVQVQPRIGDIVSTKL